MGAGWVATTSRTSSDDRYVARDDRYAERDDR